MNALGYQWERTQGTIVARNLAFGARSFKDTLANTTRVFSLDIPFPRGHGVPTTSKGNANNGSDTPGEKQPSDTLCLR